MAHVAVAPGQARLVEIFQDLDGQIAPDPGALTERRDADRSLLGDHRLECLRVRLQGEQARLNIKAAVVGAERAEFDYPIPHADGREMLETLSVGRVQKTRHLVRHAGREWEVDEFEGENAGLVVAELELEHVEAAFERPDWLGEEVTDDVRYYNHSLAMRPYRQWRDTESA